MIDRLFRRKEENYSKITTRIESPIPIEDIADGAPCPFCQSPVYKTYLPWEMPSDFDDRKKLIVVVENAPGYKCTGCSTTGWPSHAGLVQVVDQVIPIFKEKGLGKTVKALEWTKETLLEVIIPNQQ